MQIYLDPDELEKRGKEIFTFTAELETTLNSIETLVLSLNDYWQGESKDFYEIQLFVLKQRYELLIDFLKNCSNVINQCVERYEQSEKEIVSKINLT